MNDRSGGTSLVELMVATVVGLIAILLAFGSYDAARRSFAAGHALATRQRVARLAFHLLNRELRAAGYNVNPDGDPRRLDEPIEAAFGGAIVVRADFDGLGAEFDTPESGLDGGSGPVVSTGNDEIVGYVLAKPDGSSADVLSFDADVRGVPRDGILDRVSVTGVALTHDDPPYTLYRFTVRHDRATVTRAPVVDGVRALVFRYSDRTGIRIPAPGGDDDPEGRGRRARGAIRRIHLRIEVDPAFGLNGSIVPGNLGGLGSGA